jgi:hypothetical protein
MQPDIISIRGDGIGSLFFRDGSGGAQCVISADCRLEQIQNTAKVTTTRTLTSVTAQLASQSVAAAQGSESHGVGTYRATFNVAAVAGDLSGVMVATGQETTDWNTNPPRSDTVPWTTRMPFTVKVVADQAGPAIAETGRVPQDNSVAGQRVVFSVTDTGAGVRMTSWEITGVGGRPLSPDGTGYYADVDWRAVTGNPRTVPAPPELPVTIRARDAARPNGNETTIAFTLRDSVAPTIQIDTPLPDAELPNDGAGATVPVTGICTDLWSGVTGLEVALDDGAFVDLRPGLPTVTTASWTHTFRITDFGHHRIKVRARDAAGNVSPLVVREFEIAAPLVAVRGRDPFGFGSYLSDLLDFAGRTIDVPDNRAAVLNAQSRRRRLAVEMGRIFHRPVLRIVGAADTATGSPRNEMREQIEVLQRVLDSTATDLVAHWPLEEGVGPVAEDGTGNGFTARAQGTSAPIWQPGRGGRPALRFDGTDDELVVDAAGALSMRDQVSVAAWVRAEGPGTTADVAIILNKENEFELGRTLGGELAVALANDVPGWTWIPTGILLPAGEWVHVALVYDGVRILCYRNGRLAFRRTGTGLLGTATPTLQDVRIGGRQWGVARFEGLLSDVRVYRGAPSAATVARLADLRPTLLTQWALDARTTADTVTGRVLTLEGASWGVGRVGTALLFADGQRARVSNMSGIRPGNADTDFTLACWLLIDGDPAAVRRTIVVQGAAADPTVEVFVEAGTSAIGMRARTGPGAADTTAVIPLVAGRWIHLACVKDGDSLVLYIDGASRLRHRLSAPVTGTDGPLVLGAPSSSLPGFTGRIEDLRLYDTSLTASEVAAMPGAPDEGWRRYLAATYRTLLELNGTSYDELRQLGAADRSGRERLAERLGITLSSGTSDELDDLLVPVETVTEVWLEETFGLADTRPDAPTVPGVPRLLGWRLAALRTIWEAQDGAGIGGLPVLDPTFVDDEDLVSPAGLGPILVARCQELATRRAAIVSARTAASTPPAAFAAAVVLGLGVPVARLLELRARRTEGVAIRTDLDTLALPPAAFDRLLLLHDLAGLSRIEAPEWTEVDDLLVAVFHRRQYTTWRTAELTLLGGRPVTLSSDHFRPRRRPLDGLGPELLAARIEWEERLGTRVGQEASVRAAHVATNADAETLTLPILRDALATSAAAVLGTAGTDGLAQRLLLDPSSGSAVTTKARQAVQLVGGVAFALRTGRIDRTHPAGGWSIPDANAFAADWPWMSAYEAWQSAMVAFYYPENLLNPAFRDGLGSGTSRTAFGGLVDALRARTGSITSRVIDALEAYTSARATDPALPDTPEKYVPNPTGISEHRAVNDAVANAGGTPSVLVQEVLYFVPLTIALYLHRAGAYTEALDWFRLVYDDSTTLDQQAVYAGLRAERNIPPVRSRLDDWLRDLNPHTLATGQGGNPYTRFTLMSLARCLLDFADSEFTRDTPESRARAGAVYITAQELLESPALRGPPSSGALVLPPNPVLEILVLRTENQLRKLREGRNVAGMKRPAEDSAQGITGVPAAPVVGGDGRIQAPATPVLRPTGHRYQVLIERARRLVTLASHVEAAYLQAMERQDVETYRELEAGHHLELASQGVNLQRLRVDQARAGTELARRRQGRVRLLQQTYRSWLDDGLNSWESLTLTSYIAGGAARATAIGLQAAASIAQASVTAAAAGPMAGAAMTAAVPFGLLTTLGAVASGVVAAAETTAQVSSLQASFERRRDEWELQQGLANQDFLISEQEIRFAADQEQISGAESAVATIQQAQATAVAKYLATRFLNSELYEWMSGVLGDVYAYFLQQATATALLAQQQLAFERQLPPVGFVRGDYWTTDSGEGQRGAAADRRGLTGSARLLQAIEELDQYAFENDERKLNLAQTFSLASLAPLEFEQFKTSGVLPFATPMRLYDRGFPGHYLRLIKRVRVSLLALIPPVGGIRATLSVTGISRVVVGGDSFQEVVIRRDPEQVALTSPSNASGVFDLDVQADLLAPFESMGVDTSWEFQMPRAANAFDYSNVADVLMTVEYTALPDPDYRRQVIAGLERRVAVDLAIRLSADRPDQWYQLHNPEEIDHPYAITFTMGRADFPANLEDLQVAQVALAVSRNDGGTGAIEIDHLRLRPSAEEHNDASYGGAAITSPEGVVSTRRAIGAAWVPMQGKSPIGIWELGFTGSIGPLVAAGALEEVLLVISVSGLTPPWPA